MRRPRHLGPSIVFCAFLLVATIAFAALGSAQGDPQGGHLAGHLQRRLDRAEPGATLYVRPGDYTDAPLTLRKAVRLIGATPRPVLGRVVIVPGVSGSAMLANLEIDQLYYPGNELGLFDELRVHDVTITNAAHDAAILARNYVELVRVNVTKPFGWLGGGPGRTMFIDCQAEGFYAGRGFTNDLSIPLIATIPVWLNPELHMTSVPTLGGKLRLEWTVPGPNARLIGQSATREPIDVPGSGWWHLAGARWLDIAVASPGTFSAQVPNDATLLGATAAFQVVGAGRHYSCPAIALLR